MCVFAKETLTRYYFIHDEEKKYAAKKVSSNFAVNNVKNNLMK